MATYPEEIEDSRPAVQLNVIAGAGNLALRPDAQEAEPAEPNPETDEPIEPILPESSDFAAAAVAEASQPRITLADFEDVYSRYQTPIFKYMYHLLDNPEQAADITQDVFVKVYKALLAGDTVAGKALKSWVYRIAHNAATDALRRRRLISFVPLSLFPDGSGLGSGLREGSATSKENPGSALTAAMLEPGTLLGGPAYDGGMFEQAAADRDAISKVLKRMPPKYAAVLLLYERDGLSCAEIAETLDVSPSAIKMRLMRARERFTTLYRQLIDGALDTAEPIIDDEDKAPQSAAPMQPRGGTKKLERLPSLGGPPMEEKQIMAFIDQLAAGSHPQPGSGATATPANPVTKPRHAGAKGRKPAPKPAPPAWTQATDPSGLDLSGPPIEDISVYLGDPDGTVDDIF